MKRARASVTMKMNVLEDRSGCSRDTIHFYLKTGLLHAPRKTSATTALYDATHLDRLRRIRTLRDAGLALDRIPAALDALVAVPLARLHSIGLVLARAAILPARDRAIDPNGTAVEPALRSPLTQALKALAPSIDDVARHIADAVVAAFDTASPDRAARLLEVLRDAVVHTVSARTEAFTTERLLAPPRRRPRRDD